jgi:predicted nucleic acid-binding protein
MAESESIVVCDAGPIIHLDELSALNLLSDFLSVLIPEAVWLEVEKHRPQALKSAIQNFSRIIVEPSEDALFQAFARTLSLGTGEQEAIAAALHRENTILLTDDAAARLAAESLKIRVHGTIGILIRAARRNQRTAAEIATLLSNIPQQSSLHIRAELLNEIIAQFRTEHEL